MFYTNWKVQLLNKQNKFLFLQLFYKINVLLIHKYFKIQNIAVISNYYFLEHKCKESIPILASQKELKPYISFVNLNKGYFNNILKQIYILGLPQIA